MTFEAKKHLILDPETIVKHLWMVGGTGAGKSTYAKNVIHSLRSADYPNPAIVYIDPKGIDAYKLMRELDDLDDIIFLDPTKGFALNPLELPPPSEEGGLLGGVSRVGSRMTDLNLTNLLVLGTI